MKKLIFAVLISFSIGNYMVAGESFSGGTVTNTGTTFAFITIITGELLRTFSARSEKSTIFKMNLFDNKYVNYSVVLGLLLLLAVLFIPGVNTLFNTDNTNMNFIHYAMAFGLGFIPLFGGELAKLFK